MRVCTLLFLSFSTVLLLVWMFTSHGVQIFYSIGENSIDFLSQQFTRKDKIEKLATYQKKNLKFVSRHVLEKIMKNLQAGTIKNKILDAENMSFKLTQFLIKGMKQAGPELCQAKDKFGFVKVITDLCLPPEPNFCLNISSNYVRIK